MRGFIRVCCVAAIAWPVAGCNTVSLDDVATTPRVDIPVAWQVAEPAPVTLDVTTYWRELDDPLIDRYVAAAIVENRELAQATARLAQARAQLRGARAQYRPSVSGDAGLASNVGRFADEDIDLSLGVDASWEIDVFSRIGYQVAASRSELLGAGYGLADLQRLIVGQVARSVVTARSLAVQLAIARDTLVNQDDNLQIARWRNQAGLVSSLDVEQARAQRAQTAATIPALQAQLVANANTVSTLVGEAPGPVLDALAGSDFIPDPPAMVGFAPPAEVLRRRPDIRQAEAFLLADAARIGVARAQLLPLVRLTGTINTGTLSTGRIGSALFDTVTGGLFAGLSQLIFDGGRVRAQIEGAEAQAAGSLAGYEQAILRALEDVESASASLDAGRDRVVLFAEALDAARNAAILARSQYQAGLIDFQTLLTAENQLLNARNALANAQEARANAFIQLTQALGGGWSGETLDPATGAVPIILTGEGAQP